MKKALVLIALLLSISANVFSDIAFRNLGWGSKVIDMTRVENMGSRKKGTERLSGRIFDVYTYSNKSVDGYPAAATDFYFLKDSLISGRYVINPDKTNSGPSSFKNYYDTYAYFQNRVSAMYGVQPSNKGVSENPPQGGEASQRYIGEAPYDTYWPVGNDGIALSLVYFPEDSKWELVLQYFSSAMLDFMNGSKRPLTPRQVRPGQRAETSAPGAQTPGARNPVGL
jgi:hypothetical protein